MATVKPFRAFRPAADKVHLVASRSYISYKKKKLKRKLKENPFSFLHIINPEFGMDIELKSDSKAHNKRVRKKFEEFVEEDILLQDAAASFYLYKQFKEGRTYTGIIGCTSIEDYNNNVIKKHEATITKKEISFKNYLKDVKINAEPVCFTYPNQKDIDTLVENIILNRPEYDFTTSNRVRHTFWKIDEPENLELIENSFAKLPSIYIADGHHRSASSSLLAEEIGNKAEAYNYFMGIFIPEKELKIYEFNRLVSSLGKYSPSSFLKKISGNFDIEEVNAKIFKPSKNHEIGMYLDKKWYRLRPKQGSFEESDPVASLDVSILSDNLLSPILNIKDLKTDKRISFMGGLEKTEKLMKEVDSGKQKIAFNHYPISMEQLKRIADANLIMPPKSTWIEPKLRSGLTIYSLSENSL